MKTTNRTQTKRLVLIALIAALYVALCLVLAPLSYNAVQVRVSEALTLLPVLFPEAVWGVTIGCFLSNLYSMSPWDMLFGTLATLISAWMTLKLARVRTKGLPLAAALPPILVNAVIVGAEITYIFMPETAGIEVLLFNMLTVGIGQLISCGVVGVVLVTVLERIPAVRRLMEADKKAC